MEAIINLFQSDHYFLGILFIIFLIYFMRGKVINLIKSDFIKGKNFVIADYVIHLKACAEFDGTNYNRIKKYFSENKKVKNIYSLQAFIFNLIEEKIDTNLIVRILDFNNTKIFHGKIKDAFINLDESSSITLDKSKFYYSKGRIKSYGNKNFFIANQAFDERGNKDVFEKKDGMKPSFCIDINKLSVNKNSSYLINTLKYKNSFIGNVRHIYFVAFGKINFNKKTNYLDFDIESNDVYKFLRILRSQNEYNQLLQTLN